MAVRGDGWDGCEDFAQNDGVDVRFAPEVTILNHFGSEVFS